jgi:hypothetical protein
MPKLLKTGLAIAAASCLPLLASAAMVDNAWPASAPVALSQPAPLAALDFLSQLTAREEAPALAQAAPMALDAFDDDRRGFRFGVGQLITPPARLRGDVDLFLWNLLSIVHAQREGRPFELAERGVAYVLVTQSDQPAPVPLPGALWLFVMGLLGLAGTRLTGGAKQAAGQGARRPEPLLPPMGGAVPA